MVCRQAEAGQGRAGQVCACVPGKRAVAWQHKQYVARCLLAAFNADKATWAA